MSTLFLRCWLPSSLLLHLGLLAAGTRLVLFPPPLPEEIIPILLVAADPPAIRPEAPAVKPAPPRVADARHVRTGRQATERATSNRPSPRPAGPMREAEMLFPGAGPSPAAGVTPPRTAAGLPPRGAALGGGDGNPLPALGNIAGRGEWGDRPDAGGGWAFGGERAAPGGGSGDADSGGGGRKGAVVALLPGSGGAARPGGFGGEGPGSPRGPSGGVGTGGGELPAFRPDVMSSRRGAPAEAAGGFGGDGTGGGGPARAMPGSGGGGEEARGPLGLGQASAARPGGAGAPASGRPGGVAGGVPTATGSGADPVRDVGGLRISTAGITPRGDGGRGDRPDGVGGPGGGGTSLAPARPSYGAAAVEGPAPGYPGMAEKEGQQGVVTLAVTVNRDGAVVKIEFAGRSNSDVLDNEAMRTARRWTYRAAMANGAAVAGVVTLDVIFELGKTPVVKQR